MAAGRGPRASSRTSPIRCSPATRTIRPALAFASTLAPWLGIQASVGVKWQRADLGHFDCDARMMSAALGVSFGFDPTPVLLMVAGELSHNHHDDVGSLGEAEFGVGDTRGRLEAGAYYHGRPDLDLGVSTVLELGDDEHRFINHVRVAYYF